MKLTCVTITGADDNTDVNQLAYLSAEFPFVEWGILVSKSSEGTSRFPSAEWMRVLTQSARRSEMQISMHMCGQWVRELLVGKLVWEEMAPVFEVAQRVQINTHGEPHAANYGLIEKLEEGEFSEWRKAYREFIFQIDGVNDLLPYAVEPSSMFVAGLFDKSAGAGELPEEGWPKGIGMFPCGYAGGLGPDNVLEQLYEIEQVCQSSYWIDMEKRVRTNGELDMDKVRTVLDSCKPYIWSAK